MLTTVRRRLVLVGGILAMTLVGCDGGLFVTPTATPAPTPTPTPVLYSNPRTEEWREDLSELAAYVVDIHPEPFFSVEQAVFTEMVTDLYIHLESMPDEQIMVEFSKLVSLLDDGHTGLYLSRESTGFHAYPFEVYAFDEGVYVRYAQPDYEHLVEARLVSVDGNPAEDVLEAVLEVTNGENRSTRLARILALMAMPEVLYGLGMQNDPLTGELVFETPGGEMLTVSPQAIPIEEWREWQNERLPTGAEPLYLSNTREAFWMAYLPDERVLYIQYNMVAGSTQSGPTMTAFARQMTDMLEAEDVDKLVIDIRHNPGGDNTTYGPFLRAIEQSSLNQPGHLFLLTSRSTYSAAGTFTWDLEQRTNVLKVGEATGASPNQHENNRRVELSNSGLEVFIATRTARGPGPEDIRNSHEVDIEVPSLAADFFAGLDPVLEAVFNYAAP